MLWLRDGGACTTPALQSSATGASEMAGIKNNRGSLKGNLKECEWLNAKAMNNGASNTPAISSLPSSEPGHKPGLLLPAAI